MATACQQSRRDTHGQTGANVQQRGLAHARRADNGDESRGRFIGKAVDEGHMEALLFDLADAVSADATWGSGPPRDAETYIMGAGRLSRELAWVCDGERLRIWPCSV